MSDNVDPIEAAESCLAGGEPMVLLQIYQFQDDVEAHDDVLQEKLSNRFLQAFQEAANALDDTYGPHTEFDVEDDVDSIPLCGVFRAVSWGVAGNNLYLAAAHEDRETPYLLVVGVSQ